MVMYFGSCANKRRIGHVITSTLMNPTVASASSAVKCGRSPK